MNRKQLKAVRQQMGLTQAQFAQRLKMSRNSIVRMESGSMIVTPPMELLITLVAKESGIEGFGERSPDTAGHEGKGLGRAGRVRVQPRKLQNPKKGSKRRGT